MASALDGSIEHKENFLIYKTFVTYKNYEKWIYSIEFMK